MQLIDWLLMNLSTLELHFMCAGFFLFVLLLLCFKVDSLLIASKHCIGGESVYVFCLLDGNLTIFSEGWRAYSLHRFPDKHRKSQTT